MKKIVGIVAAASLVAGMAFADPTVNINFAEFTGSASVEWGVDLDAGQTGFKNQEHMKVTLNLFDAGDKSTSSDNDVWAELVMKGGNCGWWSHKLYEVDSWDNYNADSHNPSPTGASSFDIDTAKLHFGDFYVGIQNGDTQTGSYKFDGAIRSADNGNAEWLKNVGPADYSQGIVAGFGNSNLGIDVDFRSNPVNKKDADGKITEWNQYTSDYAVALEAQLKASNEWVEGLFVDLGGSMNLSKERYVSEAMTDVANEAVKKDLYTIDPTEMGAPAGTTASVTKYNKIGYSFNAGYKLKIDDKNWLKPAVGLVGTYETANADFDVAAYGIKGTLSGTNNSNKLVAGVMFGWGDTADANAGLYYFDTDATKKVTPGVSVVAWIPLADKSTYSASATGMSASGSSTDYDKVKVLFTPSFLTKGELVEGLTAAVYSEMAILRSDDKDVDGDNSVSYTNAADKDDTFALALAAAVKYDIKADEITVTPQAGFRYVNTAYADNGINGYSPLDNNKFFDNLGYQKKVDDATSKRDGLLDDGYFNLKAGVNVSGLINNTSFYAVYQSANLLNKIDYSVYKASYDNTKDAKFYNIKAGTFNVGCSIAF